MSYAWLVESRYATEEGYPNPINYDSLKILSGRQTLPSERCIFRGSIAVAKQISKQEKCNVVMFLGHKADAFDFANFSVQFGELGLNRRYIMQPLGAIIENPPLGFPFFIRPNSGWKPYGFGGFVVKTKKDLFKLQNTRSTICVVAPCQPIKTEHRFIVVGRKVVSGSVYLPDEAPTNDQATFFAQSVVDALDEPFDTSYTIDVCELDDGTLWALEANSTTTSGWYLADVPKCCEAIERMLVEQENNMLD